MSRVIEPPPPGQELPLKAQLEELPQTLQEVEAAIEEAIYKLSSITDNPEVLRQYKNRQKEIEKITKEMAGLDQEQGLKITDLKSQQEPWEAAVYNCVQKVNNLFKQYMEELGCAGEVSLVKGSLGTNKDQDDVMNFKEWGIEIAVRFRTKSSLQVLSAQHHSGGERSVSTIMYLMALQELMVAPFRCVDEINQGLDERNERLVFRRIVTNSTQHSTKACHSGQYFLITPKLLPNLTDMEDEDVTILFVFNGPFNFNHYSDWNTKKCLKQTMEQSEEEQSEAEEVVSIPKRKRRKS